MCSNSLCLLFGVPTARKCSSFNVSIACFLSSIRSLFKLQIFREAFCGRLQIRHICFLSPSHLHKRRVLSCLLDFWPLPYKLPVEYYKTVPAWKTLAMSDLPFVTPAAKMRGYVQAGPLVPGGEWQTHGAEPSYPTWPSLEHHPIAGRQICELKNLDGCTSVRFLWLFLLSTLVAIVNWFTYYHQPV